MEPFIGQVILFAGNFAPRGWAFCDGQLLAISSNTALFSILGTTYGGDGRTDFALPDLRGRSPIGAGSGPGLSTISQGETTGVESVSLTVNELPAHSHGATATTNVTVTMKANSAAADSKKPSGRALARANQSIYNSSDTNVDLKEGSVVTTANTTVAVSDTGGGQSVFTRSPALGMNWVIALEGMYPPRD